MSKNIGFALLRFTIGLNKSLLRPIMARLHTFPRSWRRYM